MLAPHPNPTMLAWSLSLFLGVMVLGSGCGIIEKGPEPVRLPVDLASLDLDTESWFGAYFQGHKVGWSVSRLRRSSPAVLTLEQVITIRDARSVERVQESLEFATDPPHVLLGSSHIKGNPPHHSYEVAMERKGEQVRGLVKGTLDRRRIEMDHLEYELGDALTPQQWFARGPAVGDEIVVREFDASDLRAGLVRYRIVAVETQRLEGVPVDVYTCDYEPVTLEDATSSRLTIASGGHVVRMETEEGFVFRRESRREARSGRAIADLLGAGRTPVDRGLGELSSVKSLTLEVEPTVPGLPISPRQAVNGSTIVLRRGASGGPVQPAGPPPEVAEESRPARTFLEETVRYPTRDPRIVEVVGELRRVVGGDPPPERDRVTWLVNWVGRFVRDRYRPGTATVDRILAQPEGDCTEHSRLLVTVARAAGIGAREVNGLVYLGDDVQAFGRHQWCEVQIDGHWWGVDPTLEKTELDVGYLALATFGSSQAAAVPPGSRLRVVDIEP